MRDPFQETGIPHINQSVYWKRVSCANAIFAIKESLVIEVGTRCEGAVHMCPYMTKRKL